MFRRAIPSSTPTLTALSHALNTPHLRRQDSGDDTLTYPLTTIFTPEATCTVPTLYVTGGAEMWQTLGTESNVETLHRPGGSSCYPDQFFKGLYDEDSKTAYYSPGVCPSGWAAVETTVTTDASAGLQTRAKCCYSGGSSYDAGSCARSTLNSLSVVTREGGSSTTTGTFLIVEPAITIAWASSDLSNFVPPSAPILAASVLATATATGGSIPSSASGTSSATAQTSEPIASPGEGGGLSTGAKAGIGVGVAAGALVVLGLVAWILYRRKKSRGQAIPQWEQPPPPQWSANAPLMQQIPAELGTRGPGELDSTAAKGPCSQPLEMSAERRRAELEGS